MLKGTVVASIAGILAIASFPAAVLAEDPPDKVVLFSKDDPEMNAAIVKARNGLGAFWEKFAAPAPNEDGFSLKIMISQGADTEHFWCGEIKGNATTATCAIANDPQSVHSVTLGQRIDVNPDHISDWMFRLDGKIKGGETIRVIIPRLPREQADSYRSLLAD